MNFRRRNGRGRLATTIDITSLVDVVFLLLIFLLVTTTFKREDHALSIELPTAGVEQVAATGDKTTVVVSREGQLQLVRASPDYEGEPGQAIDVDRDELLTRLEALYDRDPEAPIAIRAARDTRYQAMIDVVAIIERAGFRNIYFPYELEQTE